MVKPLRLERNGSKTLLHFQVSSQYRQAGSQGNLADVRAGTWSTARPAPYAWQGSGSAGTAALKPGDTANTHFLPRALPRVSTSQPAPLTSVRVEILVSSQESSLQERAAAALRMRGAAFKVQMFPNFLPSTSSPSSSLERKEVSAQQ